MSLSLRLVLLCAVAVLPAAAIQLWSELAQRRERTAEVHEAAQRAAQYAASEVEKIVQGSRRLLLAMAHAPSVVARQRELCSGYITRLERQFPEYARLTIADGEGGLICVSGEVPPGFSMAELPYFREAIRTRDFVVGEHSVGRLSKQSLLHLAQPVLDADGAVDRVAILAFNLDWLSAQLQARGLPPGGSVTVADRRGTIVARAPEAGRFVGTSIPERFQALLHAAEPGAIEVVSQDGIRRVLGFMPVAASPQGLYVSAGLAMTQAFATVNRSTWIGFLLIGIGVLSAALAAFIASRLYLGPPVRRLLQVMDGWRAGDTAERVGRISGGTELVSLGEGFDRMADALEAREAALRTSEQRLRLATEAAGLGVWEVDVDGTEIRWSPEMFALFGLEPAADGTVTPELLLAALHPEDRAMFGTVWAGALASGKFTVEFRGLRRRPGGEPEERWFFSRGRLLEGRRGRVMVGVNLDITERRQSEERLVLLAREVDHRAKNALAVVQAALRLTPRRDMETYASAVEGRVAALARAQTLLAADRWSGAELRALVEAEMAPFLGAGQRVELDGPRVLLPPTVTQALAMAVHELATNAVKHGSLSVPGGRVAVSWSIRDRLLRFRWAEAAGPTVAGSPVRRGFGSRVLDGTVRGQLGGKVSLVWEDSGLICDLEVPIRHLPEAGEAEAPLFAS
jgi:PAS domain S-box-containing protein